MTGLAGFSLAACKVGIAFVLSAERKKGKELSWVVAVVFFSVG